jgi:hypothetical protein
MMNKQPLLEQYLTGYNGLNNVKIINNKLQECKLGYHKYSKER